MKQGESFCFTADIELAAALASLDIPLIEESPYFYTLREGKEQTLWFFEERGKGGDFLTADLIKAYAAPDWFVRNPTHPFTYAVDAIKNLKTFGDWIESDLPFVSFNLGNSKLLHAKVGTPDYDKTIAEGLTPL